MALVDYPDSDDEGESNDTNASPTAQASSVSPTASILTTTPAASTTTSKRKREDKSSELPPLPAAFHDLYATNVRTTTHDDPSLHGGRKRAVPHVAGNWPSHVQLEWYPSPQQLNWLEELISSIRKSAKLAGHQPEIHSFLLSPLDTPLPLHVSLSRTLALQTIQKEPFLDRLKVEISKANVHPFAIKFTTIRWVSNYEGDRWFLVLGIEKPPHDELNKLLCACNTAAEAMGFPALYNSKDVGESENKWPDTDAGFSPETVKQRQRNKKGGPGKIAADRTDSFHISIAWILERPPEEYEDAIREFDSHGGARSLKNAPVAEFEVVKAKIGNVIHNLKLASPRGIFGQLSG